MGGPRLTRLFERRMRLLHWQGMALPHEDRLACQSFDAQRGASTRRDAIFQLSPSFFITNKRGTVCAAAPSW
jgi:hypothetical protein